MKFGHKFADIIETTHPSVSDQFLCYKTLKKYLKNIPDTKGKTITNKTKTASPLAEEQAFVRTLNSELQKFNNFFMNSEEDFVMKESRLDAEYRMVVEDDEDEEHAGGKAAGRKAAGFNADRHRRILAAFADFHGELVLMEHWVSLNYTALVKILKKHDKRSSLSLRSPFLVSVLNQPFYSTEVLSKLIVKVEGRFRKLSALSSSSVTNGDAGAAGGRDSGGATTAPTTTEEGTTAAAGETAAAAAAVVVRRSSVESACAAAAGGGGDSSGGEGSGGEPPCSMRNIISGHNLARAKAAKDFFDGLKDSDSILRPYGDIPEGRGGGGGGAGGKRSAEEEAVGAAPAAKSPSKKSKR